MKKFISIALFTAFLFGCDQAYAQDRSFSSFVASAPPATMPLGSGDSLPIVQSGTTKSVTPAKLHEILNASNITTTDSKTGGITSDGSPLTARSNTTYTANQLYQMTTSFPGVATYDAIRGVAVVTPGTTVTGVVGVGGYAISTTPKGAEGHDGNAVGLFGVGISASNNAIVWGINTLLTDTTVPGVVSSGTGREMWNELDFNVTSPNTTVRGLVLTGASISQPALAVGLEVRPLGAGKKWSSAIATQGGAAVNGLAIGTQGDFGVPSSPSQYLVMAWNDGAGTAQDHYFHSDSGSLFMDSTGIAGTGNFVLNKGAFVTANAGSLSGLVLGTRNTPGVLSDSQSLHFSWANALGAAFNVALQVTGADGVLNVLTSGGATTGSLNLPAGARYMIGGTTGISCTGPPTINFESVGGIVTRC